MEDTKLVIAKNITDLRLSKGMTQLELAEKLNYSDKAISKWERAESVPNISVLVQIADLFEVSLDYLVRPEHDMREAVKTVPSSKEDKQRTRGFITGMSILLVWLVATFIFVLTDIVSSNIHMHWIAFVYAVPVSTIVWLIFNSIWFNRRINYLIISLLVWSLLTAVFLTFLPLGYNIWMIFILGIPGQIIILMWSRIRCKTK